MNIYESLKIDHEVLKGLLTKLVGLSDKDSERRHDLINEIRDEVIPHSRAEETVLYNSMRLLDVGKKLGMQGYREHMQAETLLRTLQVQDKMDAKWKVTARELQKSLLHHIEEEENEIFAAAKQLFTDQEAVMMAEAFAKLKPNIKEQGLLGTTLDMIVNIMPPRLTDSIRDTFTSRAS